MGQPVVIERQDLTAAALRRVASREKDASAARRILALALVLEGQDRASAARSCGMDRQTSPFESVGTRHFSPPSSNVAAFIGLSYAF